MTPQHPPRIAVMTPAFQCARWVTRCLTSIQNQSYTDFHCVMIDDQSTDGTLEAAQKAVGDDPRFSLQRNDTRRFPLANLRRAAELASSDMGEDDILIVVDGDDWLAHPRVFERVLQAYADPDCWLTYGNHELFRRSWKDRLRGRRVLGTRRYPDVVSESGLWRYYPFYAGHLRTCRKFLWDAVRDADLRTADGEYFWGGGDLATVVPMLEMATSEHVRYIDDVLYVYNNDHGLSEFRPETRWEKVLIKLQIQSLPRYAPLERGRG